MQPPNGSNQLRPPSSAQPWPESATSFRPPASPASPSLSDRIFSESFPNTTIPLICYPVTLDSGGSAHVGSSRTPRQLAGGTTPHDYDSYAAQINNVYYAENFNRRHETLAIDFFESLRDQVDSLDVSSDTLVELRLLRRYLDEPLARNVSACEIMSSDKVKEMLKLIKILVAIYDQGLGVERRTVTVDLEPRSSNGSPKTDILIQFNTGEENSVKVVTSTVAACEVKGLGSFMLKAGLLLKLNRILVGTEGGSLRVVGSGGDIRNGTGGWDVLSQVVVAALQKDAKYFLLHSGGCFQVGKILRLGESKPSATSNHSMSDDTTPAEHWTSAFNPPGEPSPPSYDILLGPLERFEHHPTFLARTPEDLPPSNEFLQTLADLDALSITKNNSQLIPILLGLFYDKVYEGIDDIYHDELEAAAEAFEHGQGIREEEGEGESQDDDLDSSGESQEFPDGDFAYPSPSKNTRAAISGEPQLIFEFKDRASSAPFFQRRFVPRHFADILATPSGRTRDDPDSPPRPHKATPSTAAPAQPDDPTRSVPTTPLGGTDNDRTTPVTPATSVFSDTTSTPEKGGGGDIARSTSPSHDLTSVGGIIGGNLPDKIVLGRKIARGLSSEVYKAIDYPVIAKFALPFASWDDDCHVLLPSGREAAYNEASLLSNHLSSLVLQPYVVQLLYFAEDEKRTFDNGVTVLEDGGECLKEFGTLEPEAKIHLATGLHLMHLYGVQHRDLKPRNVVCKSNSLPKFIDFGNARSQHRCSQLSCEELHDFMEDLGIASLAERQKIASAASRLFSSK
ncbi:uncharacterized protein JCM6883_005778 [Sporobolomyces salmoneus]|uniref:uncharacterized protein n=1 Tax=Sporobolomyces salmoneus TaxID=183962 RepID=UPI00316DC2EE